MISAPTLQAVNISVRLGGQGILHDLSLSLPSGSMTVLLGPNGSGKTTLIRTLAGILQPTSGNVFLDGKNLREQTRAAVARQCAYLPQQTGTAFEIRVQDAIAMGRFPHIGTWGAMKPADYERIAWAMERVGLTELRDRAVPTLSGGERQRVFIARALAQESPILLWDEPISSLDIGRQLELMALLRELHDEGRTVLAALHDLRPALEFFPEAVLLNAGRVMIAGLTEQVIFGAELESVFNVQVGRAEQAVFRPTTRGPQPAPRPPY